MRRLTGRCITRYCFYYLPDSRGGKSQERSEQRLYILVPLETSHTRRGSAQRASHILCLYTDFASLQHIRYAITRPLLRTQWPHSARLLDGQSRVPQSRTACSTSTVSSSSFISHHTTIQKCLMTIFRAYGEQSPSKRPARRSRNCYRA